MLVENADGTTQTIVIDDKKRIISGNAQPALMNGSPLVNPATPAQAQADAPGMLTGQMSSVKIGRALGPKQVEAMEAIERGEDHPLLAVLAAVGLVELGDDAIKLTQAGREALAMAKNRLKEEQKSLPGPRQLEAMAAIERGEEHPLAPLLISVGLAELGDDAIKLTKAGAEALAKSRKGKKIDASPTPLPARRLGRSSARFCAWARWRQKERDRATARPQHGRRASMGGALLRGSAAEPRRARSRDLREGGRYGHKRGLGVVCGEGSKVRDSYFFFDPGGGLAFTRSHDERSEQTGI